MTDDVYRGASIIASWEDEAADFKPMAEQKYVPHFESVEDAEAWLAVNDVPRQLYAVGALVVWDRRVEWVESKSGVVLPWGDVEFVGKVVSWKPEWRLATHDSKIPHYQLLTNSWQHDQPELVWVAAHEIKGLA